MVEPDPLPVVDDSPEVSDPPDVSRLVPPVVCSEEVVVPAVTLEAVVVVTPLVLVEPADDPLEVSAADVPSTTG